MSLSLDYGSTFGALFVGFGLSCIIFGILSMQAFSYFQRFPKDLSAYKLLVVSVWSLELFDQVLIGHAAYTYIILYYGDILTIVTNKIVWSLDAEIIVTSFVGMIVKTCFAMRVWRFSNRSIIVTGLILSFIFTTFAVVFSVKSAQLPSILQIDEIKLYGTIALAGGVCTDVLTSTFLCFFLRRLRTGHKKSDSLVNTLTIYAINTGGLTSAISLTTLLLYNFQRDSFYFMASFFCLSKVYAISLLCTLNTRQTVRGRGTDRYTTSHGGRGSTFYLNNQLRSSFGALEAQSKSMQIGVQQEISVVSDVDRPNV